MIEDQIYCYVPCDPVDDPRIDDLVGSIANAIDSAKPHYIKALDPYVQIIPLLDEMLTNKPVPKNRVWAYLFSFLLKPVLHGLNGLNEIILISTELEDFEYVHAFPNSFPRGIRFPTGKRSFLEIPLRSISTRYLYYGNPKGSYAPDIPELHDRWLIWGNDALVEGIHMGPSPDDFACKDITITNLDATAALQANSRFDELYEIVKKRGN